MLIYFNGRQLEDLQKDHISELFNPPLPIFQSLPLGLGLSENREVSEAVVRTEEKRSQRLVSCLYPHQYIFDRPLTRPGHTCNMAREANICIPVVGLRALQEDGVN